MSLTYTCPHCSKVIIVNCAYTAAHWNERLSGDCPECMKPIWLKSGEATKRHVFGFRSAYPAAFGSDPDSRSQENGLNTDAK